jgi:hypothetical protein
MYGAVKGGKEWGQPVCSQQQPLSKRTCFFAAATAASTLVRSRMSRAFSPDAPRRTHRAHTHTGS